MTYSRAWALAAKRLAQRHRYVTGVCSILFEMCREGIITRSQVFTMMDSQATPRRVKRHGGDASHPHYWRSGLRAPRIRFCEMMARITRRKR